MLVPLRSLALLTMALTAAAGFRPAVAQQTMDFNQAALIGSRIRPADRRRRTALRGSYAAGYARVEALRGCDAHRSNRARDRAA
jgi:hypothetical protein